MTLFWIIAILFILFVLGVCIRTILHASAKIPPDNTVENTSLTVMEQRLQELENDLANGVLSPDEAENSRTEIQQSMQSESNQAANIIHATNKYKKATSIFLLAFFPVFVLLFYFYLGRPDLIDLAPLMANQDAPVTAEQIEQMVNGLEQRLQGNPEDIDGWLMFYRSNMVLQHYDKALLAAEKLYQLQGDQPEPLLRYADALAMSNNQQLSGRPMELIEQVLEIDPDNISAIWLAGMGAMEQGNIQQALDYWESILPRIEDGTEPRQQLQQLINRARSELGIQKDNGDISAINTSIVINVYISPELSDDFNPDASLFVYVRSSDANPMPIAVVKQAAQSFPVQVTLDDSNTMVPDRKLTDFSNVQIIARISNSGQAKPENGDLIGTVSNFSPLTDKPVDLIIRDKISL